MKTTASNIFKNGIWLTAPPLLFSLTMMRYLPPVLSTDLFNQGISPALLAAENIVRIFVFGLPAFFSIGLSTKTQKRGLTLYLIGLALYAASYLALILFPQSAWSLSPLGFAATAYINLFWMLGLALLAEKFYFPLRYRPIYYSFPATIFLVIHTTHAILAHYLHY